MLRRKPTRIELTQPDVDDLDAIRREAQAAAEASSDRGEEMTASAGPSGGARSSDVTRREAALGAKTDRQRIGLPALPKGDAGGDPGLRS